jgi:hypothetical protein
MSTNEVSFGETDLNKAMVLQNGLIARATGGEFDGGDPMA